MIRPTTARLGALALASLLVAAACGNAAPTASPTSAPTATPAPSASAPSASPSASSGSSDTDAIYDEIEAQVLELRGLEPADVQRETIYEAALAEKST